MNSNDIRSKFGISFQKALPIDKWSVYCPSGWSFSFRRSVAHSLKTYDSFLFIDKPLQEWECTDDINNQVLTQV